MYLKKNTLFFIQFILVSFAIIGCQPKADDLAYEQNSVQNFLKQSFEQKTKNYVSAHRGGSGLKNYPENSLETMDYLYAKGIQIFEIDVAQTKDNALILMHDNSLQRTSTGKEDVNQIPLTTIKEYFLVDDFGSTTPYKIPTFTEALKWAKGKPVYLMVDIKRGVPYEQLIKEIKAVGMQEQVVLVSYTLNQAKKLHRLAPEMLLSVAMRNEQEVKTMLNSGIRKNKMIAFTGTKLSNPSLYAKIHDHGIWVILGTLGNLDKKAAARGNKNYVDYEQMGVDIFATDRALDVHETINKN